MTTQLTITRQSENQNHRAVTCTSLGIRYEVFEGQGVVSVRRWDAAMDRNTVVGEFELSFLRGDKVRIGDDPRWRPMGDFLYNHGSSFSAARSFIGDNNVEYRWKVRQGTLMLCKGGSGAPALITFHRDRYNPNDASYLEVHDIETLESLEKVIVSFLIMERRTGRA